jgi:hypothetical protein
MTAVTDRRLPVRAGDPDWALRVRPAVREHEITQSRRFLSWCDELTGVRFACPRCGRVKAVVRRWRPATCDPIYWLLCLSATDRRSNIMSQEVFRELLAEALSPEEVSRVLGDRNLPPRGSAV